MQLLSEGHTSAAGLCNEDTFGMTHAAAWILDGATSLSRRTLRNAENEDISDATHFVSLFSSQFGRYIHQDNNIRYAIEHALNEVRKDPDIQCHINEGTDVPSASFSAVKLSGKKLQVANLGDCTILLQVDSEKIISFGSSAVRKLDAQLLSQYVELRKTLGSRTAIWNTLTPVIRKNRAKMNQPDGYWILEPSGKGLHGIEQIDIDFNKRVRGLLVTDGLYRIVDTYCLMSEDSFFEAAFDPLGLQRLIEQAREAEALDPDAARWPRIKLMDDASILKFETI